MAEQAFHVAPLGWRGCPRVHTLLDYPHTHACAHKLLTGNVATLGHPGHPAAPAGRLVAFSCADFIANDRLGAYGNLTLTLSTVNWLLDQGRQLNVPARPIQKLQLALSQQELLQLRYSLLFVLPGIAALLGLIVYWTRRR